MKYVDWEPIYHQILADFDFDPQKDIQAGKILKHLLKEKKLATIETVSEFIKDNDVYIFGAGPNLDMVLEDTWGDYVSNSDGRTIISADGATSALRKKGITPQIIVTDLDGYMPDQLKANAAGSIMFIHGHGDNIQALNEWIPRTTGRLLGTTQAVPDERNGLYNFGGFTDGDRAVFLAAHFQARKIHLVAFDFNEVGQYSYNYDPEIKFRKLTWANLLIGMIKEPQVVFHRQ